MMAVGMFAGLVFVQLTLSADVRILDAVADPPIHEFTPHATQRAPPAVAALDVNVQFVPSGDVIIPLFAAAAHKVPFHAMTRIGVDVGSVNPAGEAFVHVVVGFAAYRMKLLPAAAPNSILGAVSWNVDPVVPKNPVGPVNPV